MFPLEMSIAVSLHLTIHHTANPSHPNISKYILHTVLYKFPKVLMRRMCQTIKGFFDHFVYSRHLCL